ncbi:hypothetical protein P170DRAFT_61007 [Aspergillus steynii IBT 23096]|uniref:Uncharacterized protein n=1 Tax=Aspergillus steynii IBT 23096 TaxID=1392250 RepID=A0A2I2FSW4_9EURO|nr:uncharacterized protein P170DRAFT_61007 [Aspergillus steynii IBT 23096]PLB43719.1 hypothetical protein P170DRAFT_61007 [Aspergillus steynii IBT 23096]
MACITRLPWPWEGVHDDFDLAILGAGQMTLRETTAGLFHWGQPGRKELGRKRKETWKPMRRFAVPGLFVDDDIREGVREGGQYRQLWFSSRLFLNSLCRESHERRRGRDETRPRQEPDLFRCESFRVLFFVYIQRLRMVFYRCPNTSPRCSAWTK